MSQVDQQASTDEHYTIISADCHAGGSPRDVPRVPRPGLARRVRRLAGEVQEPLPRPPGRRPHPQLGRREAHRRPRGRRHRGRGGVPQHRARRSSRASSCSPGRPPTRSTRPAWPASGPTTAGWPTGARGSPTGGPASARSSSTTSTRPSRTCEWCKEHGLRGGVLISAIPPDVQVRQAALRPLLRPAVGGVRGPGHAGQQPRRHRHARLRQVPGDAADLHHRGAVLLAAAVRAAAVRRACSSASRG